MTLGQRIQELRKEQGLSQEGLGEALGVSRQAVSKWESDGGIPELDTLIAMSRLFGVTLGQLLGVETPKEKDEVQDQGQDRPSMDEEQVEEILRRYVQATEQHGRASKQRQTQIAAAVCAVAVVLVMWAGIKINGKFRDISNTISNLQTQLSNLDYTVAGQIQGITGQVQEILNQQDRLESSFSWEVVGFNEEDETVLLKLNTRLKTYLPGYTVQFVLDWTKTDYSTGQTMGVEVEGPEFTDTVRLPMNFNTVVSMRIRDENGTLYEQELETIQSGMHPDNFQLFAQDLLAPFSIQAGNLTTTAEREGIVITSDYPDLFAPVRGTLTVEVNGEELGSYSLILTEREPGLWYGSIGQEDPPLIRLKDGDMVTATLVVRDNRNGRETVFRESASAQSGQLVRMPTSTDS